MYVKSLHANTFEASKSTFEWTRTSAAVLKFISSTHTPGRFLLPKVQKLKRYGFWVHHRRNGITPPKRPIVAASCSTTELISEFVDENLQPLLPFIISYLQNATDFLQKVANFYIIPDNTFLVTLDVSSLFTNVPLKYGVESCVHFMRKAGYREGTIIQYPLVGLFCPWT